MEDSTSRPATSPASRAPSVAARSPAEWRLQALSPLDGRYAGELGPYAARFSEAALIRERVAVELAWLKHLASLPGVTELGALSEADAATLDRWVDEFDLAQAEAVKQLEATTNHDVKAVEYYLEQRLVTELGWPEARAEFVHFAATSEDINNLAYARMVRAGRDQAWLPAAEALVDDVRRLALSQATQPMLARTHGQAATPTTLGKEMAVFVARWERQLYQVRSVDIPGKWGGATGTLAAHAVAYPELDWPAVARDFVSSLGFSWAPLTTQVEPHDWLAELFGAMQRFGTVLLDFCRDMWAYVSLGYFRQVVVGAEVGSSAMPHKVNPIDFENAEGNAGLAAAVFAHLAEKLPVSRLQRDLSDSSALRNVGPAFGYSALAIASARRGVARVVPDPAAMAADLDGAWEVLAEALQTVMRRYGIVGGYERLKALTRGQPLTREQFHHFVRELSLSAHLEQRLLTLTPAAYTGFAGELAKFVGAPGGMPGS
ncbi:MAG TPA: adenylosuccinate lyase [Acidimicrobiales bacterium]|nr:adenylosuccinate lyase [Acidimicrobiales bacterium]